MLRIFLSYRGPVSSIPTLKEAGRSEKILSVNYADEGMNTFYTHYICVYYN